MSKRNSYGCELVNNVKLFIVGPKRIFSCAIASKGSVSEIVLYNV